MDLAKILVVTGDEKKRALFVDSLDKSQYELFFAFTIEDAIALVMAHKGAFDLLVLDFSLPNNGAIRCLDDLKRHPLYKRMPVLAIVSKEEIETASQYLSEIDDMMLDSSSQFFIKRKVVRILEALSYEDEGRNELSSVSPINTADSPFLFPLDKVPEKTKKQFSLLSFFDVYRIVDPENHYVYHFDEKGKLSSQRVECFETWNRSRLCVNCISKSCLHYNKEYIKVEHFKNHTFIIASLPLVIDNHPYSIEFIKDGTSELLLSDHNSDVNLTMNAYISHLNDLSGRDLFSGLHNKEFMNQALATSIFDKKEIEVAFLDIDAFKAVNDTYGHLVGDEVIFYLSSLLLKLEMKEGYEVGRVGGDEFLAFGPKSTGLSEIIEAITKEFASHPFSRDSEEFFVTVSVGLEASRKDDTVENLLDRVDKKLYQVKEEKKKKEIR